MTEAQIMPTETHSETKSPEDPGQESADIRRLVKAGLRTKDPLTTAVAVGRAAKLGKQTGLDITNPDASKILGLDQIPPLDD